MKRVAKTTMSTKLVSSHSGYLSELAVDAVLQVAEDANGGSKGDLDMIKVEKKPGGSMTDTVLVKGLIIDKEVAHSDMPKHVRKAKIGLLDAAMEIQAARGLLARNQSAEVDAYLTQLVAVVQDAHADVREYILGAQTGISAEADFLPVLDQYLRRFSENYGIATELSAPPDFSDRAFEPMVEVQLLRIIQEALTNVRKHARACHVRIGLSVCDSQAEVIVQDDGAGFDPEVLETAEGQKFGLRFMRERATEVGGSVQVHSAPGEGTRVIICVPHRQDER